MFELPVERTPDRIDLIRTWVPRIAMALFFLPFGRRTALIGAAMLSAIGSNART